MWNGNVCVHTKWSNISNKTTKTRDTTDVIFYLTLIDCVRNLLQILKYKNVNRINDAQIKWNLVFFVNSPASPSFTITEEFLSI